MSEAPAAQSATSFTPLVPPDQVTEVSEHIIEIVSDSGEGAQTAGQMIGTVMAAAGAGVWTVEIIPAEIEPPHRSKEGASGNRVRFGTDDITNMGDAANVVVAFNEQVLYGRIDQNALQKGTKLLIDNKWATSRLPDIREAYAKAMGEFAELGYEIIEIPLEDETSKFTTTPRRGKNMWVVGVLAAMYSLDLSPFLRQIEVVFTRKRKGQKIIDMNHGIIKSGYAWGMANLKERYRVPVRERTEARVVTNGNAAIALGAMAAGIEVCSMYPITPATSEPPFLAGVFQNVGGFMHQAEDEIAAVSFAIGASYAGKTAITITSGPGMALKTEMIGLAVMAEIPLVIVDVQRGGPSTGLPTKVEQGDLLHAMFAHTGDAPKIIIAPADIEECFHFVILARQLAEQYRGPVIVLSDTNLATGQTAYPYPEPREEWLSPPVDQSPWPEGKPPYDWDPETGLSQRPIPGQANGVYTLTGLGHDSRSKVAYASAINQATMAMRSKKIATLRKSLQPPAIHGDESGDMLVIGWGSTRGAIVEAVDRLRAEGHKVSSTHLRFLSPMEPGLPEMMARFDKVMTVEINYSDDLADSGFSKDGRRHAQLATLLRAQTLVDIDSWSLVPGQPLPPGMIEQAILTRLKGE